MPLNVCSSITYTIAKIWNKPMSRASQVVPIIKNLPANSGDIIDVGWILSLGRCPGEGHGNPLHSSCLENPHGQQRWAGYSQWGHKE